MRYSWIWLLLCFSLRGWAQAPYGHEWIRPDHQYLRLGVVQAGWYQLTASEIQKQGIDLSGIAAQSLKLYRRGREVPIEVSGEQDGRLDLTDHIGFYGAPNDGWPDTLLYVRPEAMPHPYYSLYTDTAAYFLAWQPIAPEGKLLAGKRIAPHSEKATSSLAAFHSEEVLQVFTNEYPAGNIYPLGAGYDNGYILTAYDYGEGWTGPTRQTNQWDVVQLQTALAVRENFSQAAVQLLFVGRNAGSHQVEVWTGTASRQVRKLGEVRWQNYNTARFTATLLPEDLTGDGLLSLAFVPRVAGEAISCSYARWTYPQSLAIDQIATQKLLHPPRQSSLPVGKPTDTRYFDVAASTPRQLLPDSLGLLAVPDVSSLLVVKQPLALSNIQKIQFKTIDSVRTNYLLVSHPLVRKPVAGSADPVADYASYRASEAGGGFNPLLINADEVANQFNYGEPGPLGLQRLMRWLHDKARLQYTFLVGRSRSPQIVRKQANARAEDMIPSAGWPDSDMALGFDLDPTAPDVPLVPIGRLNAHNAQHVWDYMQKVKEHEAAPTWLPWRKNILHLSGGRSRAELGLFRSFVDRYAQEVNPSAVAPRLQTLSKKTTEPVEHFELAPMLNEGVALMTLFGHSSLNITDIDIGFASTDALGYRNKGRYPAVLVNGCALGNFYFGPTPISTDWILTPNRGAILFLAHTHNGLALDLHAYSQAFYSALADPALTSQPFGDIVREGIRRFLKSSSSLSARITAQQMNLQGDPAIRIFPATRPDYTWVPASVQLSGIENDKITAWDDSLQVRAVVLNNGRFLGDRYSLRIRRLKNQRVLDEYTYNRLAVPLRDTLQLRLPNTHRAGGEESWEFVLDPQQEVAEENEVNNVFTLPVQLEEGGALALLPADGAVVRPPATELIAQIPSGRVGLPVVFEWSASPDFGPGTHRDTVPAGDVLVRSSLPLTTPSPQTFYWRVRLVGDLPPPHRIVRFDETGQDSPPPRPEGVARLVGRSALSVEEGALFQARITFENISPTAFADSVQVRVRRWNGDVFSEKTFLISPVTGNASFTYDFSATTLGQAGSHRVLVDFNAGRLPEQLYANNTLELVYEVVPDRSPPVLDVLVDNRRLEDGEAVSPQPRLQVSLYDTNPHLLRSDTTGFRVSLRQDCTQCSTVPVWLTHATWSPQPAADFRLSLPLPSLSAGTYLLTVQARDLAGNEAPAYQIRFRVAAQNRVVEASATPNPAALWVRFLLELEGISPPLAWRVHLFDLSGKPLTTLKKEPTLGRNELFWLPTGLASGLYLYTMELDGDGWPSRGIQSGKILISH